MTQLISETDVCIVGGGPAGLAAALAARQAGFEVTVVDHSQPPIDKACGEGIMPDGLATLRRLGVCLDPSQSAPFTGIRFINGAQQVAANFCNGVGLGVRRTLLHQHLVDAATRAGVRLIWDHGAHGISEGRVLLDGENIRCRWIVGADGQHSRVQSLSKLDRISSETVRFGFRQHYRVAPWTQFVEVYWSDCGQMYVTPVAEDMVCIAFITSQRCSHFRDAISHFPALALRLKNAIPQGPPRGAITGSRRLAMVHRQNVALIGEAAGFVDAITGEGLAVAFQQAIALADALKAGDLLLYEAAQRRIMRLPRAMAALMLSMDGHTTFRRRVFSVFEAKPEIFARMLAIHTGAVSAVDFGVANTLSLGWRLLTAGA